MGVKTNFTLDEINDAFKDEIHFSNIRKSTHGATDSVYFCDDKYVLKIYEQNSTKQIEEEIKLHKQLNEISEPNNVKISKLYTNKIFYIKNKAALLFYKSEGEVLQDIRQYHLKQIALFIKEFHSKSIHLTNTSENIFSKNNLLILVKKVSNQTSNKEFIEIFNELFTKSKIDFKNNGLIHGDLFVDNAIFKNNELEAVIDFSEACVGDFLFDLAVIAMSWCDYSKEKFLSDINILILNYDHTIKIDILLEYVKYACLYYMVTRALVKRDYQDLMDKYLFIRYKLYE